MKYNKKNAVVPESTNLAGGTAYSQTAKLELVSLLLTSFASDQFYRSEDETNTRLSQLVSSIEDKTFAAKAAIYARNTFGMRSITHVLAVELIPYFSGTEWGKRFIYKLIHRPDDMMEIVARYFALQPGKPLPNQLRKGLKDAFGKFGEYELSKYRASKSSVKLVDLVNLVRPVPTEKNKEALELLVKDKLKNENTWETKLTQAGQKAENDEQKSELKKEAWKELLEEKKLGYFALLRNLRNIISQAPEMVDLALEQLRDENRIKKSLVLPFRFMTAYDELEQEGHRNALVAIDDAVEISLNNVPTLSGKTLVAIDCSGSMSGKPLQIASLFGSVLYKTNDADMMLFDDTHRFFTPNPKDSLASIRKFILANAKGGGTDFQGIFSNAEKKYDRIIILSDMQAWIDNSYWGSDPRQQFKEYKKRTGANPFIYSFDLAGHGSMQFPENKVYALAGFSDKIFDIMALLETDKDALIHAVEEVVL